MTTVRRILLAVGMGVLLAVLTALLLLNGNVAAAIWMEGPYFPLTLLLPGSVDTLATMLAVVAAYYSVCSLVALTRSSQRAVILVVSVVVVVNTLGVYAWHRASKRYARADERVAQYAFLRALLLDRQTGLDNPGSGGQWPAVGDDPVSCL